MRINTISFYLWNFINTFLCDLLIFYTLRYRLELMALEGNDNYAHFFTIFFSFIALMQHNDLRLHAFATVNNRYA